MKTKITQILIATIVWSILLLMFLIWNPALWDKQVETYKVQEAQSQEWIIKRDVEIRSWASKDKMIAVMTEYWFYQNEAEYIINNCSTRTNPTWCVQLVTHASRHETKTGTKWVWASKNNLPWLKDCWINGNWERFCYHPRFENRMASIERWLESYSKFWYNNNCMEMITRSHYTPHDTGAWIENCEWMVSNFNS